MKKLIYLLIMCIIMTAFCGCSGDSSKNDDSQKTANINILISSDISGDCMSTEDFDINKDFENWYSQRYNDVKLSEPAEEITVQFDGKEYTGKYKRTKTYGLGTMTSYEYTVDFGFLEINPSNGGISYILFGQPPIAEDKMDEKTYEACRKKAQEIAEQYIDTSYFTFEITELSTVVRFSYIQYVNGKPTENRLSMNFYFNGNLSSFCNYVSEGYKNVMNAQKTDVNKLVDTFNSEQTQQLVLDKVKPLFADYECEDCEYEINQSQLYVMPDGKLMQSYNVTASFMKESPIYKNESGNPLYYEEHALLQVAIIEE